MLTGRSSVERIVKCVELGYLATKRSGSSCGLQPYPAGGERGGEAEAGLLFNQPNYTFK